MAYAEDYFSRMECNKFCVDCKWYTFSPGPLHHCWVEGEVDLVTGCSIVKECEEKRLEGGACGPEGKLFEPKGDK